MLNKLLKRCMPWMDKGRWYQIRVTGDNMESAQFDYDPVFSDVTYITGETPLVTVSLAKPQNYQVIDIKFVGQRGGVSNGALVKIDGYDERGFDLIDVTPGTIWFFINFG